ncbi:MAG: exodeoxyribonuclease VII large subunit [Planctomycetaceae bacterium]|jgi:exodeoxyribonuclease VII large subunit|nr:exodeoxyribonuclease VII large subunit [Planctomycetaceae bacterium]MCE2812519.1 exodeoxyribonuclease VII large subunit [Planctomycetaceae bacterium]
MTGFLFGDDADEFFSKDKKSSAKKSNAEASQSAPGTSDETPLSVSQLTAWIKRTLDQNIASFWIAGEVSNVTKATSGHVYLTIKDANSQIGAVLWRSSWEKCKFDIKEGMAVLGMGKLDVYGPRGTYQVVLQRLEPQGLGPLQIAFRKLHAKLAAEGLFNQDRKRPLPRFPNRIGFVTSPQGAAIHDFLEVLRRRWPQMSVLVIPAKVQGSGAAEEIAQGIELANRIEPPLDVLVVGRGGGSIEDLWAFNEEVVVRAVAASKIPVVSAVGHEIDVTLCDLVADVRALTPSEAAERIAPSRDEILETLQSSQLRLTSIVASKLRELDSRLSGLIRRPVIEQPERMLDVLVQKLDENDHRLGEAIDRRIEKRQFEFDKLASRLDTISPLKTLARGYCLAMDAKDGSIISQVSQAKVGQRLETQLSDGLLISLIEKISPSSQ